MSSDRIKPGVIHQFEDQEAERKISFKNIFLFLIVAIGLGIFSGFLGSKIFFFQGSVNQKAGDKVIRKGGLTVKEAVGIRDPTVFPDQTEGILREGGIDGEGSFHLTRKGGESQNVYLTSTTVDLSKYVGKRVRVWGKTFKGEKAGWLMDVGFIEVLE